LLTTHVSHTPFCGAAGFWSFTCTIGNIGSAVGDDRANRTLAATTILCNRPSYSCSADVWRIIWNTNTLYCNHEGRSSRALGAVALPWWRGSGVSSSGWQHSFAQMVLQGAGELFHHRNRFSCRDN